jgi:hypothetical protein
MGVEHAPVRYRVGDHQHEPIQTGVAFLQQRPPLDRLQVAKARFGLGPDVEAIRPRQSIERPEVTGRRQRDLGGPGHRRPEAAAEPLEQPQVASVPNGFADEEGANAELETNGGAGEGELIRRGMLDLVALQPREGRRVHGDCPRCVPNAEPGRAASGADLVQDSPNVRCGTLEGEVPK